MSTSGMSTDSANTSSTSLSHSHAELDFKRNHLDLESRYSGTQSENIKGNTQGSISVGTSGLLSTLSTVSFTLEQYKEFYANSNSTATAMDELTSATSYQILKKFNT